MADIFVKILDNNLAVLRNFRGHSSLATYLTVIARRTCIHELLRRSGEASGVPLDEPNEVADDRDGNAPVGMDSQSEVRPSCESCHLPSATSFACSIWKAALTKKSATSCKSP